MKEASISDIIVVGSGVAGQSAAIYAARTDLNPIVLTGDEPGGQLSLTTDVENYLGFPEGIGGYELVQRGREQAEQFGASFRQASVVDADFSERPFTLSLSNGAVLSARSVVLATGASARTLGVPGENELMGYGLSTCATCDGAFHRENDVVVVGGGDAAMEEALFLTKFADSVTVVHRRDDLRASEILAKRATENEAISFRWNTELSEIRGSPEDGVTGVTLLSHPDGRPAAKREAGEDVETESLDVQGVFYGIGHDPNTGFLEGTEVRRNEQNFVITDETTTATTVDGVFAAGDVADDRYQQAITAAGTGASAALDAEAFLDATEESPRNEVPA